MARTVTKRACSPLFDSNSPEQAELFHDSLADALGSAAKAAGGIKAVASKLWPSLDLETAAAKLRACLNADQPHKLSLDEILMVLRLARAGGDHSVMQYLAAELGYELQALSQEDAQRRAKKARKAALLAELSRLMEDDE